MNTTRSPPSVWHFGTRRTSLKPSHVSNLIALELVELTSPKTCVLLHTMKACLNVARMSWSGVCLPVSQAMCSWQVDPIQSSKHTIHSGFPPRSHTRNCAHSEA